MRPSPILCGKLYSTLTRSCRCGFIALLLACSQAGASQREQDEEHERCLDERKRVVRGHADREPGCGGGAADEEPTSRAVVGAGRAEHLPDEADEDPDPREHAREADLHARREPLVVDDERVLVRPDRDARAVAAAEQRPQLHLVEPGAERRGAAAPDRSAGLARDQALLREEALVHAA